MPLIIETGTGRADAQSYVTAGDVATYAVLFGLTPPTSPNVSIMQAMRYLEGCYYDRWVGYKKSELQALSWPRAFANRRDGWTIPESTIPKEVKDAVCALAIKHGNGEDLLPAVTAANRIKKEQIGPIMVEYADNAPSYTMYKDIEFILTSVLSSRNFAKVART
jgi:hypothetical protein